MAQTLLGTVAKAANSWLHGEDLRKSRALAIQEKQSSGGAWEFGGTGGAGGNLGTQWLSDAAFYLEQFSANRFKAKAVDLIDNSAVMSCLQWVMRTCTQATILVAKRNPDGTMGEIQYQHRCAQLIQRPNEYYSGLLMRQAKAMSHNLDGNAYWLKLRNNGGKGQPVRLWHEPHFTIRPHYDSQNLIDGYQLLRGGVWQDPIPKTDVVHFRFGLDPRRPLMGISPLGSALREVFTDTEALIYTAAILKNMGVAGMIVTPKVGDIIANPTDLYNLLKAKLSDDHRGDPLVWDSALDVQVPSYDPSKIQANEAHRLSEERITSLTGVNRMVAGLGPDPTYANMEAALKAAWDNNMIPADTLMADDLTTQLLPDFTDDPSLAVFYSYNGVPVMQDRMDALWNRLAAMLNQGAMSLHGVQRALGQAVDDTKEKDVWYIPAKVFVVEKPSDAIGIAIPKGIQVPLEGSEEAQDQGDETAVAPAPSGDATPPAKSFYLSVPASKVLNGALPGGGHDE